MALGEFELIQTYFADLTAQVDYPLLKLGIGDDCALLAPDSANLTAISTDTLVAGVHFPVETPAEDVGWKALAVNLSDLAAAGAEPGWFTLALTLPSADSVWLRDFCQGMAQLIRQFPIKLVGGDTTRGPLSITLTVAGRIPPGKALLRSGAQAGDGVFVSGCLGDAGEGLRLWARRDQLNAAEQRLLQRLLRPQPRISLGLRLRELAHSCIDVSDGLVGDLAHICKRSHLNAEIDANLLPLSEDLLQGVGTEQAIKLALSAGDDYELCFTASAQQFAQLMQLKNELGVNITRVGTMYSCSPTQSPAVHVRNAGHIQFASAFEHFKAH